MFNYEKKIQKYLANSRTFTSRIFKSNSNPYLIGYIEHTEQYINSEAELKNWTMFEPRLKLD